MTIATCQTDGCSEQGIEKTIFVTLAPDEPVFCGECGQPCELGGGDAVQ